MGTSSSVLSPMTTDSSPSILNTSSSNPITPMKTVLILQGLPGAGKTHFTQGMKAVICSADDFFYTLGGGKYAFNVTRLGEAHGSCFRKFIKACQDGEEAIVVDNTNTTANEIAPYVLAGEAYGYNVSILRILCDPEVAASRNQHGVPLETIRKMAQRIASFDPPPWWKVETVEA